MSKILFALPLILVCFAFTILVDASSCRTKENGASKRTPPASDKLAAGIWGGQHVRAEVTGKGADIEFDCAHGVIEQPIVLDREGKFKVKGKYTPEHGGPITQDEESDNRLVSYAGMMKDRQLTLTISDDKTKETIGTFTLVQGDEGRVMKCR